MPLRVVVRDRYSYKTLADDGTPILNYARQGDVLDLSNGEAARGDALGALAAHDGPATGPNRSRQNARTDAAIVRDAAPVNLDTLNEVAASIGDDPAYAATMIAALAGKQATDADLDALAALATTEFGRSLVTMLNAAALRTAAGLVVGVDVQGYDLDLANVAALATTAFGRGLLDDVDAAALRVSIGAAIGVDVQAYDADLAALAAVATTAFGRGLLDDADAAALRVSIGAAIGVDVAAYDADLAAIAGVVTQPYGRSLLALADLAALRTALGLPVAGALVQTYATADGTLGALTAVAPAATAATNIAPWGFSQAQADAIVAAVIANRVDHIDLARFVNALVDKLQTAVVVL